MGLDMKQPMENNGNSAEALVQQGIEALRQGRPQDARTRLEQATGLGINNGAVWLLLAIARAGSSDHAGEEAALNRLLEIEPQSVRGRVLKGDCRARAGDEPAAVFFYKTAIAHAEGRQMSAEALAEVKRAEQAMRDLESRGHAQRESKLKARGLAPETWSPRFRHSLELAAGRRKLFLQEPTAFRFPELPHIQYFDPAQFSWVPALEAATGAIRDELVRLLDKGTDEFRAYIQSDEATLRLDENKALLENKDWSALFLSENGWLAPSVIERCPRTWEAVLQAPVPRISGWGPTAMFSLLKSGARIAPHTGMFNTRLICHLPLIVPDGCYFRVGNDVRQWEEGKLLIFDDTIEHEAWNEGPDDRVVLIFDIWRPELSEQEKKELTALFSD